MTIPPDLSTHAERVTRLRADLTHDLLARFANRVDATTVTAHVDAALADLAGSVRPEALPEMVWLLARHRLIEQLADSRAM